MANVELARTNNRVLLTILLLSVGGAVLPGAGWLIGVVLLWLSPAWPVRDKLIGTLVIPGGLMTPIVLLGVSRSGASCGGRSGGGSHVTTQWACTGGQSALSSGLWVAGIMALAIAEIAVCVWLYRRGVRA